MQPECNVDVATETDRNRESVSCMPESRTPSAHEFIANNNNEIEKKNEKMHRSFHLLSIIYFFREPFRVVGHIWRADQEEID